MKTIYYGQITVFNDLQTIFGYQDDLLLPEPPAELVIQSPSGQNVKYFVLTMPYDDDNGFAGYNAPGDSRWSFILYPGKSPELELEDLGYATKEIHEDWKLRQNY